MNPGCTGGWGQALLRQKVALGAVRGSGVPGEHMGRGQGKGAHNGCMDGGVLQGGTFSSVQPRDHLPVVFGGLQVLYLLLLLPQWLVSAS